MRVSHRQLLESSGERFCLSAISCWEVAKLVECRGLLLNQPIEVWVPKALANSRVELLPLSPEISVESTQLPQPFHRDPADQIVVATARIYNLRLLTEDDRILAYPHVESFR